jgi:hypothetical protein
MLGRISAFVLAFILLLPFGAFSSRARTPAAPPSAKAVAPEDKAWLKYALRLTGESDYVRAASIRELKKIKSLKSDLREGLQGDQRALALDAIVALQLKEMLPELVQASATDRDGFVHLALYTLSDAESRPKLTSLFIDRLKATGERKMPAGAKLAALDMLALWQAPLPVQDLMWLLRDDSHEVRIATLSFARSFLMKGKQRDYQWIVERALQSNPYQLRVRALYVASELPENLRGSLESKIRELQTDSRAEVRETHAKLFGGPK